MSGVWQKVLRNLDFIASYDGILELNFASLRKGMTEPYPQADICKVDPISDIISMILILPGFPG
jgi:histidinol phosphatase-like PHP family hydrolase